MHHAAVLAAGLARCRCSRVRTRYYSSGSSWDWLWLLHHWGLWSLFVYVPVGALVLFLVILGLSSSGNNAPCDPWGY